MDEASAGLRKKLGALLREAAGKLDRADGTQEGTPHGSVIESRAHDPIFEIWWQLK